LTLRQTLTPLGGKRRPLAWQRDAETLAVALDNPRRLGQVSRLLSRQFYLMGAYDQAIAAGQRVLALATASGEVVQQALTHEYLGVTYCAQGDYRQAIDCLGQTVAFFDSTRHHELYGESFLAAVWSRVWLAICHAELGTFAEGQALGDDGLRIAEAVAHPGSLLIACGGSGRLALRQGDLSRALPLLERAVSICQDAGILAPFPHMAATLGVAYTLAGRVADAMPLLTRAMEQAIAVELLYVQAFCSLSLGEAQMLAGRLEEAHALAERALALAHAHQERGNEAYALRLLGDIAARREPPEITLAEAHYRQALDLADELGMRPLQAHCHLGLGTLYAATGQRQQARTALSTAIEMYQSMEMTFWLPQTEAALAQVEGR